MKKILCTGILLSALFLSACGESSSSYKEREKEITEYNTLADSTVKAYSTAKTFAEKKKVELFDYIFLNKDTDLLGKDTSKLDPLSDEDIKLFENRSVIYDDFYTAIGSSAVREVLVVKGKDLKIMTIEIIWSESEIVEIRRGVRDL